MERHCSHQSEAGAQERPVAVTGGGPDQNETNENRQDQKGQDDEKVPDGMALGRF